MRPETRFRLRKGRGGTPILPLFFYSARPSRSCFQDSFLFFFSRVGACSPVLRTSCHDLATIGWQMQCHSQEPVADREESIMVKLLSAILGVALLAATVSPASAEWRGRSEEWRGGGGEWRHGSDEWREQRQQFNGGSGIGLGGAGSGVGRGLPFVSPPPVTSPAFRYGPHCGFPYC
jgi:hypothetical protein